MKKLLVLTALASSVLLGGCVFQPQEMILKPTVHFDGQRIGQGEPVAVGVQQLGGNVLGYLRSSFGNLVTIKAKNSIKGQVRAVTFGALNSYGFHPVNYGQPGIKRQVFVSVLKMEYKPVIGGSCSWSTSCKGYSIRTVIKVMAVNALGKDYTHVYTAHTSSFAEQGDEVEGTNNEQINMVFSQAMQQLATDTQLMHFLAAKPTTPKPAAIAKPVSKKPTKVSTPKTAK